MIVMRPPIKITESLSIQKLKRDLPGTFSLFWQQHNPKQRVTTEMMR